MNTKTRTEGFTLIEVLVVVAIVLIIGFVIFGPTDDACGMELLKPMIPTDEVIKEIARSIADDPDQTVTIMVYAAVWLPDDFSQAGQAIEKQRLIRKKLIDLGVYVSQLNLLLANKGGLEHDGVKTPAEDGVYIFLE